MTNKLCTLYTGGNNRLQR